MSTCKDCKFFIQEEGHCGRCKKYPYVRTRRGLVETINGKPRTLYVRWSRTACKSFEKKGE